MMAGRATYSLLIAGAMLLGIAGCGSAPSTPPAGAPESGASNPPSVDLGEPSTGSTEDPAEPPK